MAKDKDKDKANAPTGSAKEEDFVKLKEVPTYKYSENGRGTLYEAIILQGQPYFVTWFDNKESIKIVPIIEESTRILRPPNIEEYPYTPYEFADEGELRDYFSRANTITLDELYKLAKGHFEKYVDQDKNIILYYQPIAFLPTVRIYSL